MIPDWISLGFLWTITKDVAVRFAPRKRRLTPEQALEYHARWRPVFEKIVSENHRRSLRRDVIIRDVKRHGEYPEIDKRKKGPSPWLRVGLIGTYHGGILVGFSWQGLIPIGEGEYRGLDYESDASEQALILLMAGEIPFEQIEQVNELGDEFYTFPQIFCHFTIKGEPYRRVFFCEEHESAYGPPYYVEIADMKSVRRNTKLHRSRWGRVFKA